MKFPNKVIPYRESVIAKFPIILQYLETQDMMPQLLYSKVKSKFSDAGEFIEVLDCLYALGKIELSEEGALRYAG
ncbi:MAG: hypothetical protein K6G50_13915 [bacterium]|nr:hypothetical protein [bacterium]